MKFSKTAILLAFVFLLCLAQPASSQACDSHNVTAYINYTNGVHPGALTGGIRDNNNGQIVFVSCSNCSYSNATGVLTVDLVEFDPANCSNAGDILTIYANDTLNNLGATNVTRSASSPTDAGTVVIQTAPTTTTTTTTSTTTTTTTTTT
ncbi:MAG: hypothetical protein FJY77_05250, partial [Candidatus Altiarchaeales archaeon]|nr:hypothetical protein [Candidatus Altiarchaeales archaeon]